MHCGADDLRPAAALAASAAAFARWRSNTYHDPRGCVGRSYRVGGVDGQTLNSSAVFMKNMSCIEYSKYVVSTADEECTVVDL